MEGRTLILTSLTLTLTEFDPRIGHVITSLLTLILFLILVRILTLLNIPNPDPDPDPYSYPDANIMLIITMSLKPTCKPEPDTN